MKQEKNGRNIIKILGINNEEIEDKTSIFS